jgi:hypothetical protein
MECEPVNDTLSAGKGDDDGKRRWGVETYGVLRVIIWDYLASVASSSKSALVMREGGGNGEATRDGECESLYIYDRQCQG